MSSKGYTTGNYVDKIKHPSLELLASLHKPVSFFEYHSGDGQSVSDGEVYLGSSVRVLNKMKDAKRKAFLHEINADRRKSLEKTVANFTWCEVREDWRKHHDDYMKIADEKSLLVIDPSRISDYKKGKLIDKMDDIAKTGGAVYAFVPVLKRDKKFTEMYQKILSDMSKHGTVLDLTNPSKCKGHFERTDHHLILANSKWYSAIRKLHVKNCSS